MLIFLALSVCGSEAVPLPNTIPSILPRSNSSITIVTQGWTPSGVGRGTIDIVWTCLITIFLCSWSLICLQVPSEKDTPPSVLWRRAWLTCLCGLGPEFMFQLALGQWISARQSVKDFHEAGFPKWTIKHAFYADSGGFKLHTADNFTIPVDAKQVLYLIEHDYINCPTTTVEEIDDKNKVDMILRFLSSAQTLWFCVVVIARAAQNLVITGMELTTAAFILCSFATSFCWRNKGADVTLSVQLETKYTMIQIVKDAGKAADGPYHRTPLDFISREEWHWSLYWTHWINILRIMHIKFAPQTLPHDRFENTIWRNLKSKVALGAFAAMCFAYTAIFLASWNAYFPTYAELIIWRISSLSLIATVALYFIITGFAFGLYPAIHRFFHPHDTQAPALDEKSPKSLSLNTELEPEVPAGLSVPAPVFIERRSKLSTIAAGIRNNSVVKDPLLYVPLKATLPMYVVGFLYCSSRTLILILDIIQLRKLPVSAFDTVTWSSFIPHFS